jgi:hypothetical protein
MKSNKNMILTIYQTLDNILIYRLLCIMIDLEIYHNAVVCCEA